MKLSSFGVFALAVVAAGCTTTEDANNTIRSRWIGQPSDAFFAQYGPPVRSYAMNSGGTIYTWRGGDTNRNVSPVYRDMTDSEKDAARKNPTTVINIATDGSSFQSPPPGKVLLTPGRTDQLSCEAQITTDGGGVITDIKTTRDTDGEGFSFSRCAEVFGAKAK
ncbi:hypothetical protein ACSBOB_21640 [Mesorhizobium sp. ASY16-5R]|uniref:hypothetical protein n=1 Tax=Mesorhizobium sp. ASY16-5R TaxID=3445772 RepID=UPI003FA00123